MEVISKKEAKMQGLIHYFTNKICINGHISLRYVSTGRCKSCKFLESRKYTEKGYWKNYHQSNIDYIRERGLKYRSKPEIRERERKRASEWYFKNREKSLAYVKKYNQKVRKKHLQESGLGKYYCRLYQSKKKQQCPRWTDLDKIRQIYKNCPKDMEVDHIIPLQGKLISGLHVHNNLQYLTKSENSSKGNKFNPVIERIYGLK